MDFEILEGDAMNLLPMLPDNHFQTIVTSPPYWGLRDYGHKEQIGLEKTFQDWLDKMVVIFEDCRRTLRPDGTFWLNIGDSYATGNRTDGGFRTHAQSKQATNIGSLLLPRRNKMPEFKAKDLIGKPWALAFALRAAGWYLRADIIWAKPNSMPESVTDRPTKAHEYLFLFSKEKKYYYDAEAIKEPVSMATLERLSQPTFDQQKGGPKDPMNGGEGSPNRSARRAVENLKKRMLAGWATGSDHDPVIWATEKRQGRSRTPSEYLAADLMDSNRHRKTDALEGQARLGDFRDKQRGHGRRHEGFNERYFGKKCGPNSGFHVTHAAGREKSKKSFGHRGGNDNGQGGRMYDPNGVLTRNKRSVWEIATQTFSEAHFATFPEDLVKPCILAGTRAGDLVLDPFSGSGTTGKVACGLGRKFVGIELNPEYAEMSRRRIGGPLFAGVE